MSKEQAYAALKVLREDTHKGVGDWRIDVAERYLVTPILEAQAEDPDVPDEPNGMSAAAARATAEEPTEEVPWSHIMEVDHQPTGGAAAAGGA